MLRPLTSYFFLLLFVAGMVGMLLGMQHVDLPVLFGSTLVATLGAFLFEAH